MVELPWTLNERELEQFSDYAEEHGLSAMLDALGLDALGNDVNVLQAQLKADGNALREYGHHKPNCNRAKAGLHMLCSCGLAQALAATSPEQC